ncbi:MAG: extracellular solute-binding protein [Chloroflexi bacterium]|nr:extracellular solute-binding protein [Chloroflexota bacterium]MDE2703203.1 extracellular solute-binding protein [Chloroflexota bacterium]MDE2936516.1 extracellular solute-binding protein [Chloroflexota bacterium]MXW29150.1 extracellular solute-binding protein [Chloroflexota bacterium]MXX66456.1 extracellular solute-binding protein [Chloroflexota bacterium]
MRRFSRRTALRAAATGAAGLATTAALAGCGETEVVEVEKVVTVQVAGETQIVEVEIPGEATVTERVVTIEVPVAAPAPVTQVTNIWFNQATQQENFEKNVVGHYHRQQDAFKLDPILVPNNELNVKLTAAIASGTPPDVVRVGGPILMNNFFRRGVMHDMDQFDPEIQSKDFVPSIIQALSWRGKMWAMPVNSGTMSLYYNADLYRAAGLDPDVPPDNTEELFENASRVHSVGDEVTGMAFATKPIATTGATSTGWSMRFGAHAVTADGTTTLFDSAEYANYWGWIKRFVDAGTIQFKSTDETGMTNDYGTGLLGHYAAYPSRLQNSVQNLGIEVGRVALLPRGPLSNLNPIGCGALQMPVGGKNPEGGWHFTDFIGNDPENDSIWCTAFGQIPPRFSFRDSIVYTAYRNAIPGTEPFIEGQKNSYAHYFGPGTAEIWTQFAKIQEAVILAGADIQETQAQFNSEAQAILDRALETDEPISSNPFPELAGGYL